MNKTGFYKIGKLFEVILSACFLLSVVVAQAQTTRLTIRMDQVPLERVVSEIEKQTRYLFLFNKGIDTEKTLVSVNAEDKTVPEILSLLFRNSSLDYTIEGMNVLVMKHDESAREPVTVRGTVRDTNGNPVYGAAVIVRGTTLGASTQADGSFTLQVPPPPRLPHNWKSIS